MDDLKIEAFKTDKSHTLLKIYSGRIFLNIFLTTAETGLFIDDLKRLVADLEVMNEAR